MNKRGFNALAVIGFFLVMFSLFWFLKTTGFVGLTGFTSHEAGSNFSVDEITLTKINFLDGGGVETVDGEFHIYDLIGCVVNYDIPEGENVNLTMGFYSGANNIQNPNQVYYDVFNTTSDFVLCENNMCLAYYNATEYLPGNWKCYLTFENNTELSNTLEMFNSPPILISNINDISLNLDGNYINESNSIDLNNYFADLEDDDVTYGAVGQLHIDVAIEDGLVYFTNPENYEGLETIKFRAHDGLAGTFSNDVSVTVGSGISVQEEVCNPVWDCNWSPCISGQQTCTYFDRNNCGRFEQKPADLIQVCEVTIGVQQEQRLNLEKGVLEIEKPTFTGTKRNLILAGIIILSLSMVGFAIYLLLKKKKTIQPQAAIKKQSQASNLSDLQKYIESALNQNQPEQKIRQDLLRVGWLQKDIDNSFNYINLKKFVNSKLSSGVTKEKIIESLKAKGWKNETISSIFKELNK